MKSDTPGTRMYRSQIGSDSLASAVRILSRRDHTCGELAAKLRRKGFDREAINDALARCRDLGYLDDARTAATIAGHMAERGYGPLRIRHALRQKGLDDALIADVLTRCGDEDEQVRSARRMLDKKRSRLDRETDPWKQRQVAHRFLAGRGFPPEVIRRATSRLRQ